RGPPRGLLFVTEILGKLSRLTVCALETGEMQTDRSIAQSTKAVIATLLVAGLPLWPAMAAEDSFILAQGGFEKLPPSIAPTPYSPDMPQTPQPRHDSSQLRPPPSLSSPSSSSDLTWGAIAFTA